MRKTLIDKLPTYQRCDDEKWINRDFRFELITPMFGGDSDSWVLNLNAPVRAQSVKGQLRFWWRTMQSETDPSKLLRDENTIWGGKTEKKTRIQSPVKIAILDQKVGKKYQAELNDKGFAVQDEVIPTYVAFPVTSALKKEGKTVHYVQELFFTLRITYPAGLEETVLNTLKLWTLFGGVGARTRRGCGSVYCEELMESFPDKDAVRSFIKGFESSGENFQELQYPRLQGAKLALTSATDDPSSAWTSLVRSYAAFRQDRIPNKPTPGRSYWPEPDAIRTLVKQHSKLHPPAHPDGVWFPRAAFGLPIITKFNTKGNGTGDPDPQVELQPSIGTGDRWPSPLILKAIRLVDGNVFKAALVLKQVFPGKLILKQNGNNFGVPAAARPSAAPVSGKIMKNKKGKELRKGETIYQALFRELNLEEVK